MKIKMWLFGILGVFLVWFLYVERGILTPFILAGMFAYILNPTVNFFSKRLRVPRTVAIISIYSVILAIVVALSMLLSHRLTIESLDLNKLVTQTVTSARHQVPFLPDWIQPTARDYLNNIQQFRLFGLLRPTSMTLYYTQAISRVTSFLIFLFSGFYFLKDGEAGANRLLGMLPDRHKKDVDSLVRKIHEVLGGYLRGQILLVALMSLVLYIALAILGMKFALIVAIFSGFAEIVPVVGPITAGAIAVTVMLLTGTNHFGIPAFDASLIIIAIYFVLRQLEDYLVIPHVMERITKLPPFLIFFAVVTGGHVAGILGLILAVPITAILKLLLEFTLDKISVEEK